MKFVSFKDLYEMVVNYFEGLEDDEIMLAFMHHDKRDPMLKRFDSYLTIGEHEKTVKRKGLVYLSPVVCAKECIFVYHGDGLDAAKRPNAEEPTIIVEPGMVGLNKIDKFRKNFKEVYGQPNPKFGVDENLMHTPNCDDIYNTAIDSMEGEEFRRYMSLKKIKGEERRDGLVAMCYTIDELHDIPCDDKAFELAIVKNRRDGWCACHSDSNRKNEESTHSEKEVEEKPLKDEKETKTNDEKFSSLEKFGLATNWASAMTMIKARDFLLSLSAALSDMNKKLKQEVKLEPVEEPKKDILKVKCVRAYTGCTLFIEGKVYERVNGVLVAEDAFPFEYLCKGNDPNKWMFPDHRFELYEEPKEEPKKDILRVKCTKGWTYHLCGNSMFTTGKVYERINGVLVDDAGLEWKEMCKSDNPAEWKSTKARFELYEEPKVEPKKDIIKVKCIKGCQPEGLVSSAFTAGKVYERVNGVLVDDAGNKWECMCFGDDPSFWSFAEAEFELYEEPVEKPKKDILKVKCVDVDADFDDWWTVGKVYEKVNGVLVDDEGDEWESCCHGDNPEDWSTVGMSATFEIYEEPKEEPKKDILKVKCTYATGSEFIEGKVYERVNGVLMSEHGFDYWAMCKDNDPSKWSFIGLFSDKPFYKFELYEEPKQEPVEEPKKDILKVKCVWTDRPTWWTVGKVYERVDHKLIDEDGWPYLFKISDNDPAKWTFRHAKFELCEDPKEDILKVKCTYAWNYGDNDGEFILGKVYERVNGGLTNEQGFRYQNLCEDNDPRKWRFVGYNFELCEEPKVEPKKDILRVKCVWTEDPRYWTVGKVYERVNGVLVDETGYTWERLCVRDDPTNWLFDHVKFELAE